MTWIVLGLTAWLAIGVLTAQLFGAFVSDDDDQAAAPEQFGQWGR